MAKNTVELKVLNPRGEIKAGTAQAPSPRVKDLTGKRVGLYSNSKPGMDNFYTVLEELLTKKYPGVSIIKTRGAFEIRDDEAKDLASKIDTFVYAVGD
ncbi:MAG: hypothetical protein A2Z29_02205 [Chloroflexi bacterium RBG_16_56_11]|nr:MAG: hypothetical protein A2Z29_02205 [Chloroflexi bacterium RBG_16_56_11]